MGKIGGILLAVLVIGAQALPFVPAMARQALGQERPETGIMEVLGRIVVHDGRYHIRGARPAELFRILNPDPAQLDGYARSGKLLHLQVRSVVGDNVELRKIEGRSYQPHPTTPQ